MPVRPHEPAHPLHRPHRRHADRARRQRLPVGRPRGRRRVRPRRSAATSWCGRGRPASSRSRRCRSASSSRRARRATPALADAIRERLRERARRPDAGRARAVGQPAAQRVQVETRRAGRRRRCEAPEPGRPPHHDRRRRPADVDRLLGGRARDAVRVRAAQPRQRVREPSLLRSRRRPADHGLHQRGARSPTRRARRPIPAASTTSRSRSRRRRSTRRSSGSTSAGSATAASRIAASWTRSTSRIRSAC